MIANGSRLDLTVSIFNHIPLLFCFFHAASDAVRQRGVHINNGGIRIKLPQLQILSVSIVQILYKGSLARLVDSLGQGIVPVWRKPHAYFIGEGRG